jgi:hypothetical protein
VSGMQKENHDSTTSRVLEVRSAPPSSSVPGPNDVQGGINVPSDPVSQVAESDPTVVRQFEGQPWVPLREAVRLHEAHQEAVLRVAALRNEVAVLRAERDLDVERLAAAIINEADHRGGREFDVADALARAEWIAAHLVTREER